MIAGYEECWKQGDMTGNDMKGFILDWVVREGISEDTTFELRCEG